MYAENIIPESIVASMTHDIFIQGCQLNFEIESNKDVEVGNLYPDESFRTVDECFNDFVIKMEESFKKPVKKIGENLMPLNIKHVNQLVA